MNPADVIGTGGVAGAIVVGLGYVLVYLIRKRSSETGGVETTKATLNIVREQQQEMADALRSLRDENTDLRTRLRLKDEQVDRLADESRDQARRSTDLAENIERLEAENALLRGRLEKLENTSPP